MSSADFAFFKKYLVDATRDIQSVFDLISLLRKINTEKDTVDDYCTVKKY